MQELSDEYEPIYLKYQGMITGGVIRLVEWICLRLVYRNLMWSSKTVNENFCKPLTGSRSNLTYPYGNSICALLSQRWSNTQEDLPVVTFRAPLRGSDPVLEGG